MESRQILNDKWIKASIIGAIWAASEIVLGSFLHNLKVPFAGNLLTGIGIIILVSISYIWKEKGLFWRSGVICALMKTISPSAVIFGPMIAIFSESVLMELSSRIFGRTVVGYLLGSMLAMSWNLFQKIINYIIFYGFDIIGLYTSLLKYAEKQFSIPVDMVWAPIILLLIIYCVMGILAAIIGMRVGRRLPEHPVAETPQLKKAPLQAEKKRENNFRYSIIWLIIDILLIPATLILINNTRFVMWIGPVLMVAFVWSLRYKRALRQLSKPKFWIFFVVITMLTAFIFTKVTPGSNSLKDGLMLGVQMNFRAAIVIMGFAVLGTELYNPLIINYFLRTRLRQLPVALELAFDSLPSMIASIPDFKTVTRNPGSVFYTILSQTDERLEEVKNILRRKNHVFIITGPTESGKTTAIQYLEKILNEENVSVSGIISRRIMEGGITKGYELIDIKTGTIIPFLNADGVMKGNHIGRFIINEEGLSQGRRILNEASSSDSRVIIIDEIGRMELKGGGWAENLETIVSSTDKHLIISVRDTMTEEVISRFNLRRHTIIALKDNDIVSAGKQITSFLEKEKTEND
ncbi:MAG TPA: ATPase, T2SS/T4P/T4SS family [Bacteroidales bacterium]|nr:ATPase, T2SS/T4P/T4SS family [Bacteroidales bacterium]